MFESITNTIMNPSTLKGLGAVVLAAVCFALMRVRGRTVTEAACFCGGVLGVIVVLTIIKALFL